MHTYYLRVNVQYFYLKRIFKKVNYDKVGLSQERKAS